MVEYLVDKEKTYAIILRREYRSDGINFFTPDNFSQQLGYMRRPKGYVIEPHIHNEVIREVHFTKEVILIKSGKVRIDFFDDNQEYIESKILTDGDIALLAFGGHGFEMLDDSEIVEIKQGPYAGDSDKTRFDFPKDLKTIIK